MNKLARLFAENLYEQRVIKKISQEKLSLECGFNKKYVGMLERAEVRITLEKVYIIAANLGCSVYDLLPAENPDKIEDMIEIEP